MKEKWYNKTWFMWLTLIIFSPVGIFFMWKNKKFTSKTRKILTGVFSIWFIIALATGNNDSSSTTTASKVETKTEDTTKKEEVKKEEPKFDFATAELTKENVTTAIEKIIGKDKLISVDITTKDGKNIVDIAYNPGTTWDEKSLVKDNANTATKVYEVLFKNPKIDKVWVWTHTEMTDAKGNSKVEPVINVSLTKENAKDINWSTFKDMVLVDYNKLYNIADSHFIHPGIAKNLK